MPVNLIKNILLKNRRRLGDVSGIWGRYQLRSKRENFYRQLWLQAADDTAAHIVSTTEKGAHIQRGDHSVLVKHSNVGLDGAEKNAQMADKELTFKMIAERGCPIPERCTYTIEQIQRAEQFMTRHAGNVVVKPAAGTGGGRGVTTGISTSDQLRRASLYAAGFNPQLLVEEELIGSCYRLLFLDGKFIDAVRRDLPVVNGNGRDTIQQLIRTENNRRRSQPPFIALSPLTIDEDCLNTLVRQNLSLTSRPQQGETIHVKTAVNENAAEQNVNVRDDVHPEIIAICAKLVDALDVRFAGVDLMTSNISAPVGETKIYFNEINIDPGLHHHYLISDPKKMVPVASIVLEHLFQHAQNETGS